MKKVTTYRDRATGRFVSAAKWKRSKARGGTKFVRSSYERKQKAPKKVPRKRKTIPLAAIIFSEYLVVLDYSQAKKGAVVVDISVSGPPGMSQQKAIQFTMKNLKENDLWLRKFSERSFTAVVVGPSDEATDVQVISIKRGKK